MNLSEETHNFEKIATSVLVIGPQVLHWLFSAGCKDYDSNETLREYLTKKGWTKSQIKSGFDSTTLKKLDTDVSDSHWDITLLFQLIQKVCGGIADRNSPAWKDPTTMEGRIKMIKDIRNDTVHGEPAFTLHKTNEVLDHFEDTCVTLIEQASREFGVSPLMKDQFANSIKNKLFSIRNSKRTERDVIKNLEHHFKDLVVEGLEELKHLYAIWSKVVPVFFLDSWDFEVKVDSIFTEMIVTLAGRMEKKGNIECSEILHLTDQNFILVEGQAGSGKSTLLKYFLSNWTRKSNLIQRLEEYEIILYYECRNRSLKTLKDLIGFLLSKSIAKYSMIDYIKCLLNLRVLFLLDGFDEINENSDCLVREIFDLAHKPNIHVVVTSRPSDLKNFYKIKPSMAKVKHLRLDGIPHDLHEVFVERLHKQLDFMHTRKDVHDTAMLVQYIREAPESVRKHFLFPLNLTLITVLWIISPENVHRVTTITTLYKEILSLVNEKLCERLMKNPCCACWSADDLLAAGEMAYEELCKMALVDLLERRYVFGKTSLEIIKKFCSSILTEDGTIIKIPHSEVVGAYMAVKHTWTSKSSLTQYSYPHRSFQEHMAAVALCQDIKENGKDVDHLTKELNMSFESSFLDDLVIHLIGVIGYEGEEFLHAHGPVLVGIVGNKASDRLSNEWWLTFVAESLNDDTIAKACSYHIPTLKWLVSDENAGSALALLKYVSPSKIELVIIAHHSHVPSLQDIIFQLAKSKCEVSLGLFYNYWYPDSNGVDHIIEDILEGRCKLVELTSQLKKSSILKLPNTLTNLRIAVKDEESVTILNHLDTLTNLDTLVFHLAVGLPLSLLKPLPSLRLTELTFSGITDDFVVWLINAILRLQPTKNKVRNVFIAGKVSPLSTSSHHTAGGDGLTKQGYINLLEKFTQAAFGRFQQMPIKKELIFSSLFPENSSSCENFASPIPKSESSLFSPFSLAPSKPTSSNPFASSKPKEERSILSLRGDVFIWSPILTEEERRDIRTNHNQCFLTCKLMSGSPFSLRTLP